MTDDKDNKPEQPAFPAPEAQTSKSDMETQDEVSPHELLKPEGNPNMEETHDDPDVQLPKKGSLHGLETRDEIDPVELGLSPKGSLHGLETQDEISVADLGLTDDAEPNPEQ